MHKLIFVGTPIGNLEDLSLRSLRTLLTNKVIVSEDTRNYLKLKSLILKRFSKIIEIENLNVIKTQTLISYREENHNICKNKIIDHLKHTDVVFVSDAGMPLISDPGNKLTKDLNSLDIEIDVIPGPSAFLSGLILSGFQITEFKFIGFLPKTKSKIIEKITNNPKIICFYESPHRIKKTLEVLATEFPYCTVAVIKEISKKFQNVTKGNILDVIEKIKQSNLKGEFTVIIDFLQTH